MGDPFYKNSKFVNRNISLAHIADKVRRILRMRRFFLQPVRSIYVGNFKENHLLFFNPFEEGERYVKDL